MALTAEVQPAAPPYGASYLIRPDAVGPVQALLQASGLHVAAWQGGETQVPRFTVSIEGPRPVRDSALAKLLSPRELQVLKGMARGKSNAAIGRSLDLTEDTIKTHARKMFRKLGVADRAHAVAIGFQRGILGGAQ